MGNEIYFDLESLQEKRSFVAIGDLRTHEGSYYDLGGWIDRGGNAAVFRCQQRVTGDEYAIKFLLRLNRQTRARFKREIRLLQAIEGDHITRYCGSGLVAAKPKKGGRRTNLPFIVMELADRNLSQIIGQHSGPIRYEQYAGQFRGLARALASLHKFAVHRDIKPENILVAGERWLLSDLGLCAFHRQRKSEDTWPTGRNIGPKFWLSPEASNRRLGYGDRILAASDVFQLAAIFWYVVTGRHPTGIVTERDWTGPKKLYGLLQKSMYHDHRRRPRNGAQFLTELEDVLA